MIRSVLIARGAFGDIYEPAWVRALREMGVKADLFDAHALTLPGLAGRLERRFLWGPGVRRINRRLIERVEAQRPDVLLLYQGHYYPATTIDRLRRSTFVVGFHNDDPFGDRRGLLRYRHLLPALPRYHGFHVYRPQNIAECQALGVERVGLLLPYFIPWLDHPRPLSPQTRKRWQCELLFAGHVEPDSRIDCITRAARQNLDIRVYGGEKPWRQALPADVYHRVGPTLHLDPESYRQALSGARIGACFFSKWNRDQYTRRTFEIPACGLLLLSERSPWMETHFEEDREAVFFSSPEEFVDKARFYLKNETARKRIASAGHHRVHADGHDIHSRLRQWLAEVEAWGKPSFND